MHFDAQNAQHMPTSPLSGDAGYRGPPSFGGSDKSDSPGLSSRNLTGTLSDPFTGTVSGSVSPPVGKDERSMDSDQGRLRRHQKGSGDEKLPGYDVNSNQQMIYPPAQADRKLRTSGREPI